ncbi:MAG: YdiY family protein [Sphingomonadaceae bacterium]
MQSQAGVYTREVMTKCLFIPTGPFALTCFASLAMCFTAFPAAAEIAPPLRAMIDAALASGEPIKVDVVIALAKETSPDDKAELQAILDSFNAEQEVLALEKASRLAEKRTADVQEKRQAGLTDNWKGKGEFGAFRSTGNSSNVGVTVGLKLRRKGERWTNQIRSLADYQRSRGITTREQYLASYETHYRIDDRKFTYGLAQWEKDRFQGFTSRLAISGGLGFRPVDEDDLQIELKAGPAWRHTKLTTGLMEDDLAGLGGLSLNWQVADNVTLTEDANAYYQSGNSTFDSMTGIEAGLSKALKARLSYSVEHATNPPYGAIRTDTLSRFTLVYGF